jgi:DUF1365 family protein
MEKTMTKERVDTLEMMARNAKRAQERVWWWSRFSAAMDKADAATALKTQMNDAGSFSGDDCEDVNKVIREAVKSYLEKLSAEFTELEL